MKNNFVFVALGLLSLAGVVWSDSVNAKDEIKMENHSPVKAGQWYAVIEVTDYDCNDIYWPPPRQKKSHLEFRLIANPESLSGLDHEDVEAVVFISDMMAVRKAFKMERVPNGWEIAK